jgi:hypothetical protein
MKVGKLLSMLGPFAWSLHNIVAHPLMEIVYLVGFERASNWIHDVTIPNYTNDTVEEVK